MRLLALLNLKNHHQLKVVVCELFYHCHSIFITDVVLLNSAVGRCI